MILLIGSLELIWSAHESSVWSDDDVNHKTMRAALRDHQRLLDAIRDGNAHARYGWRRTISPRPGATHLPSAPTKPLRRN